VSQILKTIYFPCNGHFLSIFFAVNSNYFDRHVFFSAYSLSN